MLGNLIAGKLVCQADVVQMSGNCLGEIVSQRTIVDIMTDSMKFLSRLAFWIVHCY